MKSSEEILTLNEEQHYVLDRLSDLKGVLFLTGKAGTGKSTLFNVFNKVSDKKIVVLAPTGVAAVNVGGQTIHSFFKFPPGFITTKDYRPIKHSLLKKIELLVIDEISMVRADMLDHIDRLLRISAKSNEPFGGIPMLWIGDLYQLPPIISTAEEREYFVKNYESPYFFSSQVMKELKEFELIELSQVFRQDEQTFIRMLNKIRVNEIDEDDLMEINDRCLSLPSDFEEPVITLCTTNALANQINQTELDKIDSEARIFLARITGQVSASMYPVDQQLILKEGAQIMTIRNATDKSYVNGSLGTIISIHPDSITIKFPHSEKSITLGYENWDIIKYKTEGEELSKETIGTFQQIPVKLAWAVTIHKSQGKTFESAIIDFGKGAFESGQTYVALSRCRSLRRLYLKQKINWRDIRTDERVTEFLRMHS
ncbi:MAG: AAA family ATPase [Saprospiraceae bacterium]|nr:AAA family ATPase [Saprospiraceae bacterium]